MATLPTYLQFSLKNRRKVNSTVYLKANKKVLFIASSIIRQLNTEEVSSSETQGQLVGTTGFSCAKVYNKSGRAPGHLLLPNEFQKRLKSRLLIGQKNIVWPIGEEKQPGDSHVFLHEVVFLIEHRSSVARSTGTFLRRASEKINK